MPFDQNDVPPRLIEAVHKQNLVLLVGAGISAQAAEAFPNWNQLLLDLKHRALASGYISQVDSQEVDTLIGRGQPLMAAEALRYSLPPDEYESVLEEKFNPPGVRPAEIHKALFRLRPQLILTTNYDRLLEDAYAEEYRRTPQVVTYKDAANVQRYLQSGRFADDRPVIFKLHGTIDGPEDIVLSERDYRQLIYRQPGYRLVLSAIFLTQTVLMIGFSFADPELRLLLEALRESLKSRSHPDYAFLPRESAGPLEMRRLRDDFGVQVIPYDPTPGHPEVLEFIMYLIERKENP
jgi:hypothetical protein